MNWSDEVRNALLEAYETVIGPSPKIRIYAGSAPADETGDVSGNTVLVEFDNLASDWMETSADGSKTFKDLPLTKEASATGIASFYRIYKNNGTDCCEQGTVGDSGNPDMLIDNVNIVAGQTVRISQWIKHAPH